MIGFVLLVLLFVFSNQPSGEPNDGTDVASGRATPRWRMV